MRNWFLLSLSLALGLASLPAGAAGANDELQSIVVTATRIPTPQSQIASSITVITAEDIANRQDQSLPDALKEVPGLNLVQSGGPGGQTSIFMRGTNSNHTKVLVDGIDLSDPSNPTGAFDFGHLLLQDVQKIEVLRGPQSGLYGSDAIGGVVNIITKSGEGPAQVTASLQGGSFDTFNQAASLSGAAERFHYMFSVDHIHSGATPVTPLGLLTLPGPTPEQRIDDYYDNLSTSTKLGFDVTEHFDLGLVARYTDSHLRFTSNDYDLFPAPPADVQSNNDTKQFYTRLTAHGLAFDGLLESTLGLAYGRSESDDFTPATPRPSPRPSPPTSAIGSRLTIRATSTWRAPRPSCWARNTSATGSRSRSGRIPTTRPPTRNCSRPSRTTSSVPRACATTTTAATAAR